MKIKFNTSMAVSAVLVLIMTALFSVQPTPVQQLGVLSYQLGTGLKPVNLQDTEFITIVSFDDQSIHEVGAWPWSYDYIAQMIDNLSAAKPSAVVLLLALDRAGQPLGLEKLSELQDYVKDKSGKQAREIRRRLRAAERALDPTQQLASALKKSKQVILPIRFYQSERSSNTKDRIDESISRYGLSQTLLDSIDVPVAKGVRHPDKAFIKNSYALGFDNISLRSDADMLRLPLFIKFKNQLYPSLALVVAARHLNSGIKKLGFDRNGVKLGDKLINTDQQLHARPKFYTKENTSTFRKISAHAVLDNKFAVDQVRNKIVIVGVTAQGHADYYPSPAGVPLSKAEVLGNLSAAIINDELFASPDWSRSAQWGFIILFVFLFIFMLPNVPQVLSALVFTVLSFSAVATEFYLLISKNIWVDLMTPVILFVIAYGLFEIYFYLTRNREVLQQQLANSNRELAQALQSQGQIEQAMEKLRETKVFDDAALELAYSLAQDFERKRHYDRAASAYDFIIARDMNYRDVQQRKKCIEQVDDSVAIRTSGSLIIEGLDSKPVLGRYEIQEEIGKGAMGVVYKGIDPKINRTVAIKTLALAESFDGGDLQDVLRRFFREAETAGKLSHPHIVTVYDAGQEHDLTYMAMEYLDGEDLEKYAEQHKKPKINWVLNVAWQVASALQYAHEQGIVHRDIKPANIMYLPESDSIKITDFGIARIVDDSTTKTGTALGTPCYMSPEQISGKKVDGRSDFFSLGVTLYELITGELPFQGDSLPALVFQITTKRQKPINQLRKRLPACVKTLIDKMLQKDVKDRYADGDALLAAIERCQNR